MEDRLILVDYKDNVVGEGYKQEVHENGLLHRAFSVFIINGNRMLIQKRANNKYHSAGLWANTCCSHPRVNEDTHDAAIRRLKEECGIECEIKEIGSFIYRSVYENGTLSIRGKLFDVKHFAGLNRLNNGEEIYLLTVKDLPVTIYRVNLVELDDELKAKVVEL